MVDGITTEFFICSCHSIQHQVFLTYIEELDGQFSDLYLTIRLHPLSRWSRLVNAVKDFLGLRSKCMEWDDFILSPEATKRFVSVLQTYLNNVERTKVNEHKS